MTAASAQLRFDPAPSGWESLVRRGTAPPFARAFRAQMGLPADGPIPAVADVAVVGAWGARAYTDDLSDATITVPGEATRRSGILVAVVSTPDASGEARVRVTPGPAVDGAIPLAGPRSMVADGAHRTMVVALPVDANGNAVADGTPVGVIARRPGGDVETFTGEVHGLLAAVEVPSRTVAGQTTLRLDVSGATGTAVQVLEVPGPPIEVTLDPVTVPLRADGRSLLVLTTARLVDRFGNVLGDGTVCTLSLRGPTGVSVLRAVTIGGRATFHVEAADTPGDVTVQIEVDGVRSAPSTLTYTTAVAEFPVVVTRDSAGALLTIGPVLDDLGAYVPDGTVVTLRRGTEVVDSGQMRDGLATFTLDVPGGTELDLEVLGAHRRVVTG